MVQSIEYSLGYNSKMEFREYREVGSERTGSLNPTIHLDIEGARGPDGQDVQITLGLNPRDLDYLVECFFYPATGGVLGRNIYRQLFNRLMKKRWAVMTHPDDKKPAEPSDSFWNGGIY